jgi:hypothetical protein
LIADVAVVTPFALIKHAVTAWNSLTVITAILRVLVGVVTTFARSNKTISADRSNTRGETPVGLDVVAIITGFSPVFAGLQIQTAHAVAAARDLAVISTSVCVVLVGVVTTLKAGRALGEVSAHDAVTTAGDDAVRRALIGVDLVTVIARFVTLFTDTKPRTSDTVAAACERAAVGARILIHAVAIITGLSRVLGSITADTAAITDAVVKGAAAQRH